MLMMIDPVNTFLRLDIITNEVFLKFEKFSKIKRLILRYDVDVGLLNKFKNFKHIDYIEI